MGQDAPWESKQLSSLTGLFLNRQHALVAIKGAGFSFFVELQNK